MTPAALLLMLGVLGIAVLLSLACHVKPEDMGKVSEGWIRRHR